MTDDGGLVARVLAGDRHAAEMLFARCWPEAWQVAAAVVGRSGDVENVAQEAVVRIFERLDRFDQSRPFVPWARRVATNVALSALRRRQPGVFAEVELVEPVDPSTAGDERSEPVVVSAVQALSDPLRVVVVLRYWLDLTIPEISEALGIAEGTVASRMSRATAQLRRELLEATQ